MDVSAKIAVLQRSPFLSGLEPLIISALAEHATDISLALEEILFRQGDPADHHYLVAWGRLRLDQTTADGKNIVLRYMSPGDLVGSVAVLRAMPYPATPVAVDDLRLLRWTASRFETLMAEHPPLAMRAMRMMGGRIEELQERLQQVSTQQVERRIAAALLRLVSQSGRKVDGGVEIPFPLSRQDLAELTGTTLHTVSRTLSGWMTQGLLEGRRSSHLVITRPHKLIEIAEQV